MDKKDTRSKGFNPALAAPYKGGTKQMTADEMYAAMAEAMKHPGPSGELVAGMITDDKMAGNTVPLIDNKLKFEPGKIGNVQGVDVTLSNGVNISVEDIERLVVENARLRDVVQENHDWHKTYDETEGYEGSDLRALNVGELRRGVIEGRSAKRNGPYDEPFVRFCPECGSVGTIGGSFINCCPDGNHARRVPESVVNTLRQMFVRSLDLTNPALDVRTRILVRDFSKVMADRFMEAQKKRGLGHEVDWMRDGWADDCRERLNQARLEGNMADVANYAAIIWHHTEGK